MKTRLKVQERTIDPSALGIPAKTEQNKDSILWRVLDLVLQGKLMQATPLLNKWQPDVNADIRVMDDETALLDAIERIANGVMNR